MIMIRLKRRPLSNAVFFLGNIFGPHYQQAQGKNKNKRQKIIHSCANNAGDVNCATNAGLVDSEFSDVSQGWGSKNFL